MSFHNMSAFDLSGTVVAPSAAGADFDAALVAVPVCDGIGQRRT